MNELDMILSCALSCINDARFALADEHEGDLRHAVQELLNVAAEAQALVRQW